MRLLRTMVALSVLFAVNPSLNAEIVFDVNDVAYLWPVPDSPADVRNRISAGENLLDGDSLWPKEAFERIVSVAQQTAVDSSSGRPRRISFGPFKDQFESATNWIVASMRIDPSAPGTSPDTMRVFGSKPQLRLVVQPVTVSADRVVVHDFTAHLVFDFIESFREPLAPGLPPRSVPDKTRFRKLLKDLRELKASVGVETKGNLGIHPAIRNDVASFNSRLRTILKNNLRAEDLNTIAFMGLQRPEPWIFFGMRKVDGVFQRINHPSVGHAQMFSRRGGTPVMPQPNNRNLSPTAGVATATLFNDSNLNRRAFPGSTDPKLSTIRTGDIPDIIDNPSITHVANTDCVSCHTSSSLRDSLSAPVGEFAFKIPDGISGVDESLLPGGDSLNWNVRAFGWGHPFSGGPVATITQRTANEAAESADFINREYFSDSHDAISHPLTLILDVKSTEDFASLKAIMTELQSRPDDQNPVLHALDDLGMVHFARFVILEDVQKFMVITAFDGDLETYIEAFADAIGPIFDKINRHIKDAPPSPVSENSAEFLAFVEKHNHAVLGKFYSAYPKLSVQRILTLRKNAEDSGSE